MTTADDNDKSGEPTDADLEEGGSAAAGRADCQDDDPLAEITRERDDYRDRYQRALADMENAAKRHRREMTEHRLYSVAEFARELLPVVDNLQRALDGVAEDHQDDPFVAGVKLVENEFLRTLENHGVSRVEAIGEPFDPMHHEAIMQDERGDVEPGTVTEELARGYRLGERLLRAAVVKVAKAPAGGADQASSPGSRNDEDDQG